jgi:hypothetical protein
MGKLLLISKKRKNGFNHAAHNPRAKAAQRETAHDGGAPRASAFAKEPSSSIQTTTDSDSYSSLSLTFVINPLGFS